MKLKVTKGSKPYSRRGSIDTNDTGDDYLIHDSVETIEDVAARRRSAAIRRSILSAVGSAVGSRMGSRAGSVRFSTKLIFTRQGDPGRQGLSNNNNNNSNNSGSTKSSSKSLKSLTHSIFGSKKSLDTRVDISPTKRRNVSYNMYIYFEITLFNICMYGIV